MYSLQSYFEFVLQRRAFSLILLMEVGLAFVIYTNAYFIEEYTGMPILDMEIGYSIERVNEILGAYGPQGLTRYKLIMMADMLHPAVYGTLLGALIWTMCDRARWRWLSVLPLMGALFDWGENAYIWKMVTQPLPVDAYLVEFGSLLSLFKHGTLAVCVVVLGLLFMRRIYRGLVY